MNAEASDSLRKPPARISVVVPLHNEAEGVGAMLRALAAALGALGSRFEIIAVDDGSVDSTWQKLADAAAEMPQVRALRLSRRFGKEAALCAGLERACGDVAITMDGDLQHPPSAIAPMLDAWRRGADVVDAVKVDENRGGAFDRVRAGAFYSLLRRLSGYDLRGASDFKLLDRRALVAYRRLSERNVFFRGMTAWLGFRRAEVPFSVGTRRAGESRWTLFGLLRLAITAVTSFSAAPLHFITTLGVGFLLFSIVFGAQTLYRKLSGTALDGFTTVILLLLIIGSVIMIGLGIIGEYLARIYDEVKARPRYVIEETIGGERET